MLLTGLPGIGKTTVLRRVAEALPSGVAPGGAPQEPETRTPPLRGFLTDEVREGGGRVGFRLATFDGREAVLSHLQFRGGPRVGRYGVDVSVLDRLAEEALALSPGRPAFYLVDEIGKMECFSPRFVAAMKALFDAGVPVVATIARYGAGFIAEAKRHPAAELWEVTSANRNEMPGRILAWLGERTRPG